MIDIRGLTHRYGGKVAVDDVSCRVEDGEFLAIVGPNGSGKTTLVRHCNGLLEPDIGSVFVNGESVQKDLVAARTAVGMVFQDPKEQLVAAIVGVDVAFGPENLGLDRCEINDRVDDALDAVNMRGHEMDRVDELSGGELARVAIAGVLAMDPDHLILDEAFSGLDYPSRCTVLSRIQDLHRQGTSIVVVTHDLRDVFDLADRIIGMVDGQILIDAPPTEAAPRLPGIGVRVPTAGDQVFTDSEHCIPDAGKTDTIG